MKKKTKYLFALALAVIMSINLCAVSTFGETGGFTPDVPVAEDFEILPAESAAAGSVESNAQDTLGNGTDPFSLDNSDSFDEETDTVESGSDTTLLDEAAGQDQEETIETVPEEEIIETAPEGETDETASEDEFTETDSEGETDDTISEEADETTSESGMTDEVPEEEIGETDPEDGSTDTIPQDESTETGFQDEGEDSGSLNEAAEPDQNNENIDSEDASVSEDAIIDDSDAEEASADPQNSLSDTADRTDNSPVPEDAESDHEREAREKAEREGLGIVPMSTSGSYSSEHMWYEYNEDIDIRGYANGNTIQTTYSDRGYETYLECDGSIEKISLEQDGSIAEHSSGLTVTPNVTFSSDGSYVIVRYTVKNTTGSRKSYNLGVCADVDIDSDDYATVRRTDNGLSMVNRSTGRTYYLVCKNISGYTKANTLWFGYYGNRTDNVFNNTDLSELTETDSGLAFSWKNRTISSGGTAEYVYQIGIGEEGAIVDYSEEGHGFTIGVDTNSFNHSYTDFFHCSRVSESEVNIFEKIYYYFSKMGKKVVFDDGSVWYYVADKTAEPDGLTYKTSTNFYDRLISGLSKSEKSFIQHSMKEVWDGSCHGVAISMALASQNINHTDCGITTNYSNAGAPRDNRALRNAINFYQLSQYTRKGKETDKVNHSNMTFIGVNQDLVSFLRNLAQEGMRSEEEKKPFVFSFGNADYGHSIVAYGAVKQDDNHYRLRLFDENGTSSETSSLEMTINLTNGSFSFTDANNTLFTNDSYEYLSYIGIDDLYGTISTMEGTVDNEHSLLIISEGRKVLVTNERGEYISYDGQTYSGTMTVYDYSIVGEGRNRKVIFYVDSYESLEMSGMDEEVGLQADIGGEYYSVNVENADSVNIQNENIEISGENYIFSAATSAGTENTELVEVSAEAEGKTVLDSTEGSVSVESDNTLSNVLVLNYDDTDVTETQVTTDTDTIDITDNDDGTIIVNEEEPITYNLSDCNITLTNTTYTYTGTKKLPSVTVRYGDIKFKKNTDYTVTYKNNINAGTGTVTIRGIGNCTGTVVKKIKIKPVSISKAKVTCPTAKVWAGYKLYPVPTLKVGSRTLKKGTDFSLSYTNNQHVGKAVITIKGKGNYTGTLKRAFKINPKPTVITKISGGSKKLSIKWKKQKSQTTGYQIQYSSRKDFKTQKIATVANKNAASKVLTKLAKKRKYYVRIRTYKRISNVNYYSTWSAVKTGTTK